MKAIYKMLIVSSLFRIQNIGVYAELFDYFGNTVVSLLFIHRFNLCFLKYSSAQLFVEDPIEDVKKGLFGHIADFSSYKDH